MAGAMHVGIENPTKWRKVLLNAAVDSIQALKNFEIHKKINKEKAVYRKHFIQVIKNLSNSIQEFQEKLPIVYTHHPQKEEVAGAELEKKEKTKVIYLKKKPRTELTKLEEDISSLKDKIASI